MNKQVINHNKMSE